MNRNEGKLHVAGEPHGDDVGRFFRFHTVVISLWPEVEVAISLYLHCHRNSSNYHHLGSYF